MNSAPSLATPLDDGKYPPLFAMCPLCHTSSSLSLSELDAGADWQCVTCSQRWDAPRLSTVAAYAAWVVERGVGG